jgi:hypothetical protein
VAAAYASIPGLCALLGISERKLGEIRQTDESFPDGRLFGGGGTLRFYIPAVLDWAESQPPARWSTIGSARGRGRAGSGQFAKSTEAA